MGFFTNIGAEPILVKFQDLYDLTSLINNNDFDAVYKIEGKRGEYFFRIQPTYKCENLSENGWPCRDCVFNNFGFCRLRDLEDFEYAHTINACSKASTYYFKQA